MISNGNSRICGVGAFLPDQVVDSLSLMEELKSDSRFGINVDFMSEKIGIKSRRIADEFTKPSDMAIHSSEMAIARSGIEAKDIGQVIFCGIDRDWQEPSTAHRVQQVIGASNAECFDVTNACHGFIDGITIADSMIASGKIESALICTGEKSSKVLFNVLRTLKDSNSIKQFTNMLGGLTVGDAGGAVIMTRPGSDDGFKRFNVKSDGRHTKLCYFDYNEEGIVEGKMHMKTISNKIVDIHRGMIEDTYNALEWSPSEVNLMLAHQVGDLPHRQLAELAGIPIDRAPVSYAQYGNLTSATIPVLLYENQPGKGDKVLILGAGSGLTISQSGVLF